MRASTRPARCLASGDAAPPLPQNLGLTRSFSDGGKSWESVSGIDDAELSSSTNWPASACWRCARTGRRCRSQTTAARRSRRATRRPTRRRSTSPSTRETPQEWAVSSEQGVFISTDDGGSWRQRDVTFGPRLGLGEGRRADQHRARRQGAPQRGQRALVGGRRRAALRGLVEVTAVPTASYYAVLPGGELVRSADGRELDEDRQARLTVSRPSPALAGRVGGEASHAMPSRDVLVAWTWWWPHPRCHARPQRLGGRRAARGTGDARGGAVQTAAHRQRSFRRLDG